MFEERGQSVHTTAMLRGGPWSSQHVAVGVASHVDRSMPC